MTNNRKKSSRCGSNACVEVDMVSFPDTVQVYDSHGNRVTYTHDEWRTFVEGVKLEEFDV
jgi:uncharacterized protein DUF397